MSNKCVLILSGGMDSGTLLFDLQQQGFEIHCLTFDYGQRHRKEIYCAQKLAEIVGASHEIVDLSALKSVCFKGSSQTDDAVEVPEGHYAEENMKLTVVPNRNMIMLSVAIAYAISLKIPSVYYGAHAGDHAIYPDCRPEFVEAMVKAAKLCDWFPVQIIAPYQGISKIGILERGSKLGVPYDHTWTCYVGGPAPCEKCGACQERAEAFNQNKQVDPLVRIHV